MDTAMNWGHDQQGIAQERAVLKEWDYLQQALFTFALAISHAPAHPRRRMIEDYIAQITGGCARIWWEPDTAGNAAEDSRLFEVHYQHIRYGMLELASGYLVSKIMPGISQHFADLCALILRIAEHEVLVQYRLAQLPRLIRNRARKSLTAREKDMLQGLIRDESRQEIAHKLDLGETTVHTHMQRLYRRLDVHSSKEAVLRAFELSLVDWLDLP